MHPLLAKLVGRPAIENWRQHLRAADESVSKLRALAARAGAHPSLTDAAQSAFDKTPSAANYEKWLTLESQRVAAFALYQKIQMRVDATYAEAIRAGGVAKLEAACDEAEAELNRRAEQIKAEDARRSAELGETVESPAAFGAIEHLRESIAEARRWRVADFQSAVSTLAGVIDSG